MPTHVSRGFTLIELVLVIIVLNLTAVSLRNRLREKYKSLES